MLGKINIFGKSPIYLVFRSLIRNFDHYRSYYHSEMKRKTSFPFAFRSFIRNFAPKFKKYVFIGMENKNYKRTTVTSALPYANGGVHIGHLAGVYVPADIYVRYLRLKKREVLFVGGSDEHGVPITVRARKEGITPQDVVDRYHKMIKDSFEEFGISFDIYSRTTSETHHKFAADWFKKLYDEGKLTEETTEQLYDEEAKQFLADRYVTGECPHCHAQGA